MLSLKAELLVLWSWFSLNLVRYVKHKLWSRPGNAQSFKNQLLILLYYWFFHWVSWFPSAPCSSSLCSSLFAQVELGRALISFLFFSFLIWEVQERVRWPFIVSLACEFPGSPRPTSPLPWNFVFFLSVFRQEVDKWYKCLCAAIFT